MATIHEHKITLLPGKEYPQKDEDKIAHEIVKLLQDQMLRLYQKNEQKQLRQIHPKMNGCVKAEFIIEKNLPEELKVGLFKDEKSFPSWIRFSNGNTKPLPDWKKDIRGFAIKIMNVPGEKIVESKANGGNLDFILMNTKSFVSREVSDFYSILKVVTVPYKPGSFFPKLISVVRNLPILMRAGKAKIKCNHPFELNYYSTVPFRFGDETRAVKYAVIPSEKNQIKHTNKKNKDFLKHNMAATLASHEIIYDFFIQFQTDAEKMPIEDPTVEWNSPFIKMATIRIPSQKFDAPEQNEFGDNLAFNSWHALPEHRPLGNFNRARKIIYGQMNAFRHLHNHIKNVEPEAKEDFFNNTNFNKMDKSNQQIIEQMYRDFAAQNIPGVLSIFDKDIIFSRPGAPFIPFSGTFTGIDEVIKMFQIQNQTLKMKSFVPDKICTNEDSVVVIGHDEAEVIETGKSYAADWVQAYTFKAGKIIHAQVFMDTKLIADAFSK